jgi:hypothetical protein
MRHIVSAAQRNFDGKVIMSVRHMDYLFWKVVLGLGENESLPTGDLPEVVKHWQRCEQGFVDNDGVFLTREQAYPIALAANQILPAEINWLVGSLHSEHLY